MRVMIPVCSAGSNQTGESETCTAHVNCPAGASERPAGASERPCAAAGTGTRLASRVRARARIVIRRRAFMDCLLSALSGKSAGVRQAYHAWFLTGPPRRDRTWREENVHESQSGERLRASPQG